MIQEIGNQTEGGTPPPPQNTEKPEVSKESKKQLISDIRKKLMKKIEYLEDNFTQDDGTSFTLRVLTPKELMLFSKEMAKELKLEEKEWYKKKESILSQVSEFDTTELYLFACSLIEQALVKIDGEDVKSVFEEPCEFFSTPEEGLSKFICSKDFPLWDVFSFYMDLASRDSATETEVKKS